MGLFQKAYETYTYHKSLVGKIEEGKSPLLPISHILQNIQIEISINLDGEFVSARTLDKKSNDSSEPFEQPTIIPATIDSASRSGTKAAAHPLSDKLAYLIKSEDSKHKEYMQLLTAWEASAYTDDKLTAIKKYIESGAIVDDLAKEAILKLDSNGQIGSNKVNGVDPLQCMVRWRVYGSKTEECWRDQELFNKWADHYNSLIQNNKDMVKGICMISGKKEILANKVPKGIINRQHGAQLISSNDSVNFVFRGRFTDAEQASSIGYESFQKVFVILKWLANNRATSFNVSDRTFICWNPKGKKVPMFNSNILGGKSTFESSDYFQALKETLSGFRNNLPAEEDVVIAAFDAATTGRLSVVYYNELKASDFLDRINSWYSTCYWQFYKYVESPTFYDIIRFAFGVQRGNDENAKIEVDDKLLKQHMQRLFKCLVERLPIPHDIVKALTVKTSQPQSYSKNNREKILSIACSVIRKYYNDKAQKEEWTMSLDKEKIDRSYLFGRLLAVYEKCEIDARKSRYNFSDVDIRETHADKLWTYYCAKPETGAANLQTALRPYLKYLPVKKKIYYLNLETEILNKISDIPVNIKNKSLEPSYLLGYSNQRIDLYKNKKDEKEEDI